MYESVVQAADPRLAVHAADSRSILSKSLVEMAQATSKEINPKPESKKKKKNKK